jgi:hypothetical protein
VNDHAAALGLMPKAPALAAAWRIGFFRSLSFKHRDGSVISGRGPPRAGPSSFSAILSSSSDRRHAALPRPDSSHPIRFAVRFRPFHHHIQLQLP